MPNAVPFPPVTIGISNYNGADSIASTMDSIKSLVYPSFEILVCDDASTDDSIAEIKRRHPDVPIVRNDRNEGVSQVRNVLLDRSPTNLVFLVDNDIKLDPFCLQKLVEVKLAAMGTAVVVTPRILTEDGTHILSDGVQLHYLAAAVHYNRYKVTSEASSAAVNRVACGSGGMMLVDRSLASKLDYFDEDFRFGWADTEFFIRASYSGFECYNVQDAIVFHRQKVWGTNRAFWQIRNRWYIILINYSWRTLFMILPAALIYETLLLLLMTVKGRIGDYLRGMWHVFQSWPALHRKRLQQQARKVVCDRNFLTAGNITIDPGLIRNPLLLVAKTTINIAFDLYWKVILSLRLV